MLKRYITLGIVIILFITIFIINNNSFNKEKKTIKKEKKVIYNKDKFEYSTIDSDDIEGALKEEKKTIKIVKEEVKQEPVIEEPPKEEIIEKKNGLLDEEGNTYYYVDDVKQVGKQELDGNTYYFDKDGILQKDKVIDNCYYDTEGKLYTGFKDIDKNTMYFNKEGFLKGINEIEGKKYYFNDKGYLLKSTFVDKYYIDEDGSIVTGSKEINGRIYIFNEEGNLQNGYQVTNGKTFFLDENMNPLKGIHLIDNQKNYFDFETGELIKKDIKSVIDISSWQEDIDFEEVKNSNLVDGIIVRVGYGTTNNDNPVIDNKFERNIEEIKRLGIPYGIYIYGYAQSENAASIEANFVLDIINKYKLELSYPIFYDAENTEFEGVKYTKTMYKKVINKFISVLNEKGFNNVGVYGNLNSLEKGNLSSLQKRIPKWVAQYHTRCEYDGDYIGWQYTSSGMIPGINTKVDQNIFY